ncbi:metallophosphoesterase [bacterium]|nr:metallophosphoesterase [bacterium]
MKTYDCKFLAFSCIHAPLQSEAHIEEIIKVNQDKKPNEVIMLGDLFEASAASKWGKENAADLIVEYERGNDILESIRKVNPDAKYTFLEGNHDANILAKGRFEADIRNMLDFNIPQGYKQANGNFVQVNREFLENWNRNTPYVYHRTRGSYRLGAVCFAHGFEAGTSSDEMQAIHFNQLWANSLFISGHTHRPTEGVAKRVMKTKGRGLPFWYLNAGCSCDIDKMDYMDRKQRGLWGNGYVLGSCDLVKSPRLSKTWEAECFVTKWFEE